MAYRTEIHPEPGAAEPYAVCVPAALLQWPVSGWTLFDSIAAAEGRATRRDSGHSTILGLSYSIHTCACSARAAANGYDTVLLRIDSWRYDLSGESTDLPVMEMTFDAARFSAPSRALTGLKIMARPVKVTEKIASRAVNATLFFLGQIQAGQVPDFERILELHRLHPELNGRGRDNEKGVSPGNVRSPYARRPRLGPDPDTKEKNAHRKAGQSRVIGPGSGAGRILIQPASDKGENRT